MAYGVLKLLPREVRRLTPGELMDCIAARVWVVQERERARGDRPAMTDAERAAKVAQIAAFVAAKQAKQGTTPPSGA